MKLRELLEGKNVFFTIKEMDKFIKVYGEEKSDKLSFYGKEDIGVPVTLVKEVKKALDSARIKYTEHK